MTNIWDKFNKDFDANEVQNSLKGEYKESIDLPIGKYEAAPKRINFIVNKKGNPMTIMNFEVLEGDLKGEEFAIFQNCHNSQTVAILIQFLKTLDADGEQLQFTDFSTLVKDAETKFRSFVGHYEYVIDKRKNKNDFDEYKIEEIFVLE